MVAKKFVKVNKKIKKTVDIRCHTMYISYKKKQRSNKNEFLKF